MSLSWRATILFAILLGAASVWRDSASGALEGIAIGFMILFAVLLVVSFLSAILLPVILRRR